MFLADQHPGGGRQALHQLLRADQLAISEIDDMPQVGVATPLTALPAGQRWQVPPRRERGLVQWPPLAGEEQMLVAGPSAVPVLCLVYPCFARGPADSSTAH